MTISTVYKWTDANAPVLSGTAGSLINVLTKCLVDGYGEMAGAGWERTFANVALTIAAFRNISGNGRFFRIDEETVAANLFTMQGYEVMTNETTGTGPFFATTVSVTKSTAISSASRSWVVVANDKGFWLYFYGYGTDPTVIGTSLISPVLIFFGDFIRFGSAEEGFNTVIGYGYYFGTPYLRGFLTPMTLGSVGDGYIRTPRDISGAPATPNSVQCVYGGISACITNNLRYNFGPTYDGSRLLLGGPFYIADSGSFTSVRGYFPGLFYPCHTPASFTPFQVVTVGGRSFINLLFKFYANSAAYGSINLFIELGVDWHA
jgi:hypothetical protein